MRSLLRWAGPVVLAVALAAACSGTSRETQPRPAATPTPTPSRITSRAAGPCGWSNPPPIRHVVWIWMENRAYDDVLGTGTKAPRLSSYARACGLATNYRAITHPSLPNYLAATSGSTGGVTSDCSPRECPQTRPSIFGQLDAAGLQWRTYAEAMPSACNLVAQGRYATKHNPAVYFTRVRARCRTWDLPMTGTGFTKSLPAFTFVEPDICDDGHDCSTAHADAWLGATLNTITRSPSYAAGDVAVFVTWDEGIGADQHVATVVVAPSVPRGTRSNDAFTHYSLLRTTEALLGLPLLGAARTAADMRAAFGLR